MTQQMKDYLESPENEEDCYIASIKNISPFLITFIQGIPKPFTI